MPRGRSNRTPEKREAFLTILSNGGTVKEAREAAGISRSSIYDWRKADEDFAAAWDHAYEEGTDELETEAVRRAKDGSDTLMIFLLKARRPEKYRDNVKHEHTGGLSLVVETGIDRSAEG